MPVGGVDLVTSLLQKYGNPVHHLRSFVRCETFPWVLAGRERKRTDELMGNPAGGN